MSKVSSHCQAIRKFTKQNCICFTSVDERILAFFLLCFANLENGGMQPVDSSPDHHTVDYDHVAMFCQTKSFCFIEKM